ncbi:MAG: hypothetical protein CL530_07705 [Aequorivita sp.]|nr:hypothetical protein [Aequorivita sp.]
MKTTFTETQKFTQWWLWLLLFGVAAIPVYTLYTQIYLGIPVGNPPISDAGVVAIAVSILAVVALFLVITLRTRIDASGVRMQFFPFLTKNVSWAHIKHAEVINYGFVGGWGIRLWTPYGTVYNIKGNKGLAIQLLDGKKFLIGTQKPKELIEVLQNIKK